MMDHTDTSGVDPCLAKRKPGEPMFTLLGRDPFAGDLVWLWAQAREAYTKKPTPHAKLEDARRIAYSMHRWCTDKAGRDGAFLLDHLPFDALREALERRGATVTPAQRPMLDSRGEWVLGAAHETNPDASGMQRQGSSLKPADGGVLEGTNRTTSGAIGQP